LLQNSYTLIFRHTFFCVSKTQMSHHSYIFVFSALLKRKKGLGLF